jgi:hypothetical protein
MGIPGGDNWLVEWVPNRGSNRIFVYVIDNGVITAEFNTTSSFDVSRRSDFDIMKDIPGTRIGTGSCVVHDYNGDGFDDIFNYAFGGRGYFIRIIGYDHEKNGMVDYADIPFAIVDRRDGPAPVEFIKYKGMEGFMVHYYLPEVAGGPGYIPDPSPKNDRWFFYAWDGGQRKFVEIEEVDPRYIGVDEATVQVQESQVATQEEAIVPIIAITESEPLEETIYFIQEGNGSDRPFNLIILLIIIGVIVFSVFIIFFTVKNKKKG